MASHKKAHLQHSDSPDDSSDGSLSSDFEAPKKGEAFAVGSQKNNSCVKSKVKSKVSKSVTSSTSGAISDKSKITCKFCNGTFSSFPSVSRHRKICQLNPEGNSKGHKCDVCGRQFSRRYVFQAHIKGCKPDAHCKGIKKTKCPIPGCGRDFLFKSSIHEHLIKVHKRSDVKEVITQSFKSFEEFVKWKTDVEDRTFTYYSQQYGKRNGRLYFYCQKDGENRCHDKEPRKTNRKNSKGSVKKNQLCLSMMAVVCGSEGDINVRFYASHSHKCLARDLKFQPLSADTNEFIRRQLAWNVPPRKIVENLRDDSYKRENRWQKRALKRDNIVKVKTIAERRRKSKSKQRYADEDSTSVYMKVRALMEESFNPVLIFKPQGEKLVFGPAGAENLPDERFLFGIQTQEQMEMMKKHSKVILAIDETHGTNHYGFQLLNLVVKDEFNLGYPVGHCISSCSDEPTLQYFFKAIKERCPDMSINCCITDGDPALINSLEAGFHEDIWHILCIWHIHRNVQCNLREHVKDSKLVDEMYQVLCLVIDARTEEDFNKLVKAFLLEFGHVSPAYKKYFETKFLPKSQKWAMCFRQAFHGGVETTMLVESFHNILKSVYLRRVPNRRLDDLIDLLLQIEEDYFVRHDNAMQLETLWPHDVRKIRERHERGNKILDEDIEKVSNQCYVVSSQEKNSQVEKYKVVRCVEKCDESGCLYNCPSCLICSHMYQCTCPDTSPLCKHIHKVHLMYFTSSEASPNALLEQQEPEFFVGEDIVESCLENTESVVQNTNFSVKKKLEKIKGIMKDVEDQLENSPVKKFMLARIQNVLSDLHCQCKALTDNKIREKQVPDMEKQVNIFPNEKLQVQVKPFKRVKKTKKKGLQRPNRKSAEEIKKFLFQDSNSSDDNEDEVDDVNPMVLDDDNYQDVDVGSGLDDNENYYYIDNELTIAQNPPKQLSDEDTINKFFKVLADQEDSLYSCMCNISVNQQLCKESPQNIQTILVPSKLAIGWIVAAVCTSSQELWYFNPLAKPNSTLAPAEMKFLSSLASCVRSIFTKIGTLKIQRHFDNRDDPVDSAVLVCWFGYNISINGKGPVPHLLDVISCRNEINDAICM
ncbi:Krueppel-like protein 1 [Frankliniella fusca]|uniref:Krueppel-like protein 1 n=1 Tax=Frankliniella fusca TaxID=407009 RepID=A0AAE1HMG0_9NEOP|nr:Krueppel-like protein 1 [Frankliniella fusca]